MLKSGAAEGFGNPRFSPDGRFVVHAARELAATANRSRTSRVERHCMSRRSPAGPEVALVANAPAELDWNPVWTPDSRRVVFKSNRSGEAAVWAVPVIDGKPQREPERVPALTRTTRSSDLRVTERSTPCGVSESNVFLAEVDPETWQVVSPPKRVNQVNVGTTYGPFWPGLRTDSG